ncbi:DMT family protein [Roseomonas sp. F4]
MTSPYFLTPLLLVFSNVLMTFAWYGHLKQPSWPLWLAVLASWGIAFFEYCFAVPANRIGYGTFTGQQLKVMQEVITLAVFAVFSVMFLGEQLRWTYFAAMGCLVAAVVFIFLPVD